MADVIFQILSFTWQKQKFILRHCGCQPTIQYENISHIHFLVTVHKF